jgi:hypothetical protein
MTRRLQMGWLGSVWKEMKVIFFLRHSLKGLMKITNNLSHDSQLHS